MLVTMAETVLQRGDLSNRKMTTLSLPSLRQLVIRHDSGVERNTRSVKSESESESEG